MADTKAMPTGAAVEEFFAWLMAGAFDHLDRVPFEYRTDAMRMLAVRYRDDLERMVSEDRASIGLGP